MTKSEIIYEFNKAHNSFWYIAEQVPDTMVNTSVNGKWSAAQHVEHINKTLVQFGKYMSMPIAAIAEKFGHASRPTDIAALLRNYHAAIAGGAKATTTYVPDAGTDYDLPTLISKGKVNLQQVGNAIDNWNEADLDKVNCPHPLLGVITAREMCLFIVHHVSHHQRSIEAVKGENPQHQ